MIPNEWKAEILLIAKCSEFVRAWRTRATTARAQYKETGNMRWHDRADALEDCADELAALLATHTAQ